MKANTKTLLYMIYIHGMALVAIPYMFMYKVKFETYLFTLSLYYFACLGTTAGAHRLWSHRSYKAAPALQWFLVLAVSCANQGSIFHWVRDHRVHHKHSETDADPHNAKRGFFFAHMGWLFQKKHPKVIEAGIKIDLQDLYNNPIVMFQKKYNFVLSILSCFILPTVIPMQLWNETFWASFLVCTMLRTVLSLHGTWLVNSWAHLYGERPYSSDINPAESFFVALLTNGEGWHNYHHTYPFDYATSELGIFQQYNPTKLFIDICCTLGLASDRKRATNAWKLKKKNLKKKHLKTQVG